MNYFNEDKLMECRSALYIKKKQLIKLTRERIDILIDWPSINQGITLLNIRVQNIKFILSICRFLKKVYQIWGPKNSIFKIRGTHVKPTFFETLYFQVSKKSLPTNFLKSIFFMGTSMCLNLLIFFNFLN